MQIQLSLAVEQVLEKESKSLGITAAELSMQILAQHAAHWESTQAAQADRSKWTNEDYVDYLKSRNPNYETTDPYAVDWQAVRAEGRRY